MGSSHLKKRPLQTGSMGTDAQMSPDQAGNMAFTHKPDFYLGAACPCLSRLSELETALSEAGSRWTEGTRNTLQQTSKRLAN